MSLSNASITALNQWGATQEFGAYGQVDGNPATSAALQNLGTLLDSGKMMNDNYRDEYVQTTVTGLTASTTKDFVVFIPPVNGTIQSFQLVTPANIATTTTVGDNYTFAIKSFNSGVTAFIAPAVDLQAGLGAGVLATLPTNNSTTAGLPLIVATSTTITLTAATSNLTISTTGTWTNLPNVGDTVLINSSATVAAGATAQNAGVYKVTSVATNSMVLAKQWGANPQSVSATAAGASDAAGVVLVPQGNPAQVTAGTMIGLEIVAAAGAVAVSQAITVLLRFRPA